MSTYADTEDIKTETLHEKAKRRIKASLAAFKSQRDREEDDLRFQVPEYQWDEPAKAARAGGNVNGVPTSARPILSISKIDQPIQLVYNQAQSADLGVNVHPVSEKASKDGAEVRQGIYRRIERDSHANRARLWAFDRASKVGMGAYLVTTRYDDDAPETFDQEIGIQRLLYQSMVGFDPDALEPDFSDGEFSWMGAYVAVEPFKRQWPKSKLSGATESEFLDFANSDSDWFVGDGLDRKVLVVTYWYKVHDYEEIKIGERTRKRDVVSIRCAKLTATDELEDEDTNGHLLPLIPVIGRELQPFKNERRWVGMIAPAKDGQKLYNFSAATFVESMASEPKNPWLIAEGQEEGHEAEFQLANIRNLPYIRYKPTSLLGQPVAPPQRTPIDTSKMQLAVLGMQEADQMIQATTSIYDPSLGKASRREESGRKVLALQGQSDAGTSHWVANWAEAVAYEARVVLDLMPAIYDRPGRVCRIVTGEDKDKVVMLNRPFVPNSDGFPVAAPEGTPEAKMYDLRQGGGYSVSVSIGKSFQTRLQQGSEQIGQILESAPDLLPVIGDIYFGYQDIPGADEIKERMAKWREKMVPGLGESEDGQQPTVEQLSAQLQAQQQQSQMMQAQLQGAMKALETEQAKQQATLQKAEMDNQAKVALAKIEQETAAHQLALKMQLEKMSQQFEAMQAALDRQHEMEQARFDAAHEVAMAAAGGNTVTRRREGGQEQGRESAPDDQADGAGE